MLESKQFQEAQAAASQLELAAAEAGVINRKKSSQPVGGTNQWDDAMIKAQGRVRFVAQARVRRFTLRVNGLAGNNLGATAPFRCCFGVSNQEGEPGSRRLLRPAAAYALNTVIAPVFWPACAMCSGAELERATALPMKSRSASW